MEVIGNIIKGTAMIKEADDTFQLGIFNGHTGGTTRCREKGCKCVISNEEYYKFESTNKICTGCGHYYYNHDVFN